MTDFDIHKWAEYFDNFCLNAYIVSLPDHLFALLSVFLEYCIFDHALFNLKLFSYHIIFAEPHYLDCQICRCGCVSVCHVYVWTIFFLDGYKLSLLA